ncbi:MAG: hypothetical protein WA496_05395 [Candidatus Udaeobacter sp.]
MADNDKRKLDIPWGTLLPLLGILAGVIATYKPLVSERPSVPSEKTALVIAAQDVDARLWQDPIGVAQKQKALLDEQIEKGVAKTAESHDICSLTNLLSQRVSTFQGHVLLLAVMLDAGPYSEQSESRLRARQAVLEGLSESGFVPVDGEHVGYVTAAWPPPDTTVPSTPIERALLLPWEECEAVDNRDPKRVFPEGTKRVVVVWLPAADFNIRPLRCFAALIDQLAPGDLRGKIDIRLIGPANSTGLHEMLREAAWDPLWRVNSDASLAVEKALDGVWIISPRATASDAELFFTADLPMLSTANLPMLPADDPVKAALEQFTAAVPHGLHFVRTIAPDDWVLDKLIRELARREIYLTPPRTSDRRLIPPKLSHIVILSEWDTFYGRSLERSFEAKVFGKITRNREALLRIHPYFYLRGIDGRLPGDQSKDNQREQEQKTQLGQNTVPVEATEGLNQSDYLRRLARQMKERDAQLRQDDRSGIRAIGLLGSDIYDKLMILRALRPQFPDAVFFTNNYDAHFERRDDWNVTHNLVIASPFGNALPEIYVRQQIPPFRDSNQTSMYVGTLVATTKMKQEEAVWLTWQPRIFEISRQGAYELSVPWYRWDPGKSKIVFESRYGKNEKTKMWFRDWLFGPGVIRRLIIIALAVLAMAAWISLAIARRTLSGGGTAVERLKRAFVSTVFWLVCGGPLIIFVVALVAQDLAPEEPLAFFSGISIWPTEMVRLIAFMLAIFFMFKASFDLRANAKRIETEFSFAPLPPTPFRWRDLGIGFEHWQMKEPPRVKRFSADDAWHTYLCRNKFWPRFIRIGILFALYSIFAFAILHLFPQPLSPARGETAFQIDNTVFYLTGVGLLLLSFYVVDAIQLNSNFIRMFGREVTKWNREVVEQSYRQPPLTEKELSAYNEIFFVAQRTQVVAPLIWYPLVVLTLIIVARLSLFDNWTWPASLVLIYAIIAAWVLGSAILLRRAAEQLRETALNDLRRFRLLGQESEAKRKTFDELMAEIRDLKMGAFAPLTEQPFIRAALFPGAALGLLAVGQRLLDLF